MPVHSKPKRTAFELTEDERFVQAFLVTAKQHRIADPFYLAQKTKGWTRGEWDQKRETYELRRMQRWMPVGEGG